MKRRFGGALLRGMCLIMASVISFAASASAQTTATTGVSVEVVDAGSFSVQIATSGIAFTTEEGSAPGVTAFRGNTAYATLPIVLSDTRSTEARGGYELRLAMDTLTIGDGSRQAAIDASNIRVTGVEGVPDGLRQGFEGSLSMASPVTVLRSGEVAPAVSTTVVITLELDIPAGTPPGSFSGGISVEVIPLT